MRSLKLTGNLSGAATCQFHSRNFSLQEKERRGAIAPRFLLSFSPPPLQFAFPHLERAAAGWPPRAFLKARRCGRVTRQAPREPLAPRPGSRGESSPRLEPTSRRGFSPFPATRPLPRACV